MPQLLDSSGPLSQSEALTLLQRTCDPGWLSGMLADPNGAAVINVLTSIFEAASESAMDQVALGMISTAPAGQPGVSTLRLAVPTGITLGAGTIPRGTPFVTSLGVELVTPLDIPVAAGQTAFILPLVTLRQLDLVNGTSPAFDDALEVGDQVDAIVGPNIVAIFDGIGTVLLAPTGSPREPGVLTYVSSDPITGATMDWLSEHGNERGCRRQPGEDGETYRARIRQIPDAVTPTAIQQAAQGAAAQLPLPTVYMVEPYIDQASDDARAAIGLVFQDSLFSEDGFSDDPLGVALPGKLPWRDCATPSLREGRAYFRESVAGQLVEPDGYVLYADVGYCDDPVWGYPDIGMHPTILAALRATEFECQAKKAGGVQFDLTIENALIEYAANALVPFGALITPPDITQGNFEAVFELDDLSTVRAGPWDAATLQYYWRNADVAFSSGAVISAGRRVINVIFTWQAINTADPSLDYRSTLAFQRNGDTEGALGINSPPANRLNVDGSQTFVDGVDIHDVATGSDADIICTMRFRSDAIAAWSLVPPTGRAWLLREGLVTCDSGAIVGGVYASNGMPQLGDSYAVRLTLEDGSVLQTPWSSASDGVHLRTFELARLGYYQAPVVRIDGIIRSTGGNALNLVGTFWVTDAAL